MSKVSNFMSRTISLAALSVAAMAGTVSLVQAAPSGELVILNWLTGSDGKMWEEMEAAFSQAYPDVKIRNFEVTAQGDARGGIRTALLGGEVVDIIINTWPAFRAELNDAGVLRPVDDVWDSYGWDAKLSESWRQLGSINGETYGVTFTYGDRSGIWYKTGHLEKAGIETPKSWDEFLASFDKLKAVGYDVPVAMPGKYWAHGEWFETLLLRTAGVDVAAKLAAHEISWTDPVIKTTMLKFAEMLNAGCCGTPAQMFANDWDGAADQVFQANTSNYLLIGTWMNGRATNDYGLKEGVDYSLFQFPTLGMGHDDTSSVDAKELNVTSNGANPEAANAFLDFVSSKAATEVLAKYGYSSPSSEADTSLLGPVQQIATAAVAKAKVQFVLGDLLPGDLVDEYRVQLQRFLQDPSEANIDKVLAAIEAKAESVQ